MSKVEKPVQGVPEAVTATHSLCFGCFKGEQKACAVDERNVQRDERRVQTKQDLETAEAKFRERRDEFPEVSDDEFEDAAMHQVRAEVYEHLAASIAPVEQVVCPKDGPTKYLGWCGARTQVVVW